MSYQLMWSPLDRVAIQAEMAVLRANGHGVELAQVLAYVNSIAAAGPKASSQNIHMAVAGRNLYSACPFQALGVYYAYESPPTTQLYILGFFLNRFSHVATAAARLANVP